MIVHTTRYGQGVTVALPFDTVLQRTRDALAREGFGVLCDIDVAATLQRKLGVDFPPYVILGACNPPLAHRALTHEPDIGLLLPCNVIVREEAPGVTVVAVVEATELMKLTGNVGLGALADEVQVRLNRCLEAVAGA